MKCTVAEHVNCTTDGRNHMGGHKLHLVYEAGEGVDTAHFLIQKGNVSAPLCGTRWFAGQYRMTINLPLANACKKCIQVYAHRYPTPTTKENQHGA